MSHNRSEKEKEEQKEEKPINALDLSFWAKFETDLITFAKANNLTYCATAAHVQTLLSVLNDTIPIKNVRKVSVYEIKIAALTIAGKIIFNDGIYENLDIAHFLSRMFSERQER